MARRRDNAYSRLVGILKVSLPLAALALLSMVFMVARTLDPNDALPYAQVDIDQLLADPRLTAPVFTGMTPAGDEIEFTADAAHPKGATEAGARALNPQLTMTAPEGTITRALAAEARLDPSAGQLVMSGQVQLETSTGYQLQTEELLAALDRTKLESQQPVTAQAPQTQIWSETMELSREAVNAPEVLVFKGKVRLIYQPETSPNSPPPSTIP